MYFVLFLSKNKKQWMQYIEYQLLPKHWRLFCFGNTNGTEDSQKKNLCWGGASRICSTVPAHEEGSKFKTQNVESSEVQ